MNGKRFWQKEQPYWLALGVGLVASLALNPSWLTLALLGLLAVASYLRRGEPDSQPTQVTATVQDADGAAEPEAVDARAYESFQRLSALAETALERLVSQTPG